MAIRPEAIPGLYNIECAVCGCAVKSDQIYISPETQLPICLNDYIDEESIVPRITPPISVVPIPSRKPVDKFKTYDTPEE